MMRYLPARVVMVPATVALAAGCGAEITGKSASAPASAKVIARHMSLTKAPGYVACTAPTGPNSPLGRHGEYPFDSVSWIPAHRAATAGLLRCASAGSTRPGRVSRGLEQEGGEPGLTKSGRPAAKADPPR